MRLLRVIKRGIAVTMLKYLCTRRNLRPVLWNGDKRLFFNFQRGRGNSKEVTLDGFLSPSVQCTLKLRKLILAHGVKRSYRYWGEKTEPKLSPDFKTVRFFFFYPWKITKCRIGGSDFHLLFTNPPLVHPEAKVHEEKVKF